MSDDKDQIEDLAPQEDAADVKGGTVSSSDVTVSENQRLSPQIATSTSKPSFNPRFVAPSWE